MAKPKTALVVGAGIAGLSSAFHLAEKGIERVILLDKGEVGAQGNVGNTGAAGSASP